MFRVDFGASRGLRLAVLALAAVMLVLAVGTDPADARHRRRHHRIFGGGSYHPAYAAIVVDANSGEVMHAANADSPRHPASITKIMTLYLLFEQIEAGRIKLDTPMQVSEEAASQAPTKLGVRPGQTITVEEAIKGLVTKSANDAAVVIAEALAGDQETFAKAMTRKARALGMTNTLYRNANGLPDDEQVTTARDQALLGRAIQERFPRFYRYFSTTAFYFRGRPMRNHNHLLGRVQGVDGIKTGYTRASGFNLVTSVRRGNRHIVAVVLGGASAGARDARMRSLIEEYIGDAATQHTAARITERGETAVAVALPPPAAPMSAAASLAPPPQAPATAATARADDMRPVAEPAPPAHAASRIAPGSTEPIRAIRVKTLTVRPGALKTAALAPIDPGPQITPQRNAAPAPAPIQAAAAPPVAPPPAPRETVASAEPVAPATAAPTAPEMRRSGWIIQIGAFPAEDEAKERLKSARTVAKSLLGRADPFTERVVKGETTLFRARFAGLDEDRAEAACKQLKRNKIACFAVKN
jgi:D-alanyl-D-alanine carboxypeptidase